METQKRAAHILSFSIYYLFGRKYQTIFFLKLKNQDQLSFYAAQCFYLLLLLKPNRSECASTRLILKKFSRNYYTELVQFPGQFQNNSALPSIQLDNYPSQLFFWSQSVQPTPQSQAIQLTPFPQSEYQSTPFAVPFYLFHQESLEMTQSMRQQPEAGILIHVFATKRQVIWSGIWDIWFIDYQKVNNFIVVGVIAVIWRVVFSEISTQD